MILLRKWTHNTFIANAYIEMLKMSKESQKTLLQIMMDIKENVSQEWMEYHLIFEQEADTKEILVSYLFLQQKNEWNLFSFSNSLV